MLILTALVLADYFIIASGSNRSQIQAMADSVAEKTVSQFLNSVDIVYLAWPQSQTKPEGDTNRAVLNEEDIRIIKIEQVEVDEKNKLIENSVKLVQP